MGPLYKIIIKPPNPRLQPPRFAIVHVPENHRNTHATRGQAPRPSLSIHVAIKNQMATCFPRSRRHRTGNAPALIARGAGARAGPRFVNAQVPKRPGNLCTPPASRGQPRPGPRFEHIPAPKKHRSRNAPQGQAFPYPSGSGQAPGEAGGGGKPPLRDRADSETNTNLRTPRGCRGGRLWPRLREVTFFAPMTFRGK